MHPTNLPCWTAMASGAPVPNQFLRRSGYSKKPTKERSIFELEKLNESLLRKLDKKPTFNGRKCYKNDWVTQPYPDTVQKLQEELEYYQLENLRLEKENIELKDSLVEEQERNLELSNLLEEKDLEIDELEHTIYNGNLNLFQMGMEIDDLNFQCEVLQNKLQQLQEDFSNWKQRQCKKGQVFLAMLSFTNIGNKIIDQEEIGDCKFEAKGSVPRKMFEFWADPLNKDNDTYGSPDVNDIDFLFKGSQKQFKNFWEKLVSLIVQTNSTIKGFPFNFADVSPIKKKENLAKKIKFDSFFLTLVDKQTNLVFKLEIVNDYGEMEHSKLDFDVNSLTLGKNGFCTSEPNFLSVIENIRNKECVINKEVDCFQQQLYVRIFKMMLAGYKIIGNKIPELTFAHCDVERDDTICVKYICNGYGKPTERTIGLMSYIFMTKHDEIFRCPHCRTRENIITYSSKPSGIQIPDILPFVEIDSEDWMKNTHTELQYWLLKMESEEKIILQHAISVNGKSVTIDFMNKMIAFSSGDDHDDFQKIIDNTKKITKTGWNRAYTTSPVRSYNKCWFEYGDLDSY